MLEQSEASHAPLASALKDQHPVAASVSQQPALERDEVEEVNAIVKNLQKAFNSPLPRAKDQLERPMPLPSETTKTI